MSSDRGRGRCCVVLGDSIVAGWGVREGCSYPALLQRWLNEGDEGVPYSIINAGVPGDTVVGGCLRYARDVRVHAPDTLLIAFGLNDGALQRAPYDAGHERTWRTLHAPWEGFLLYQRGGRVLQRVGGEEVLGEQQEAEPRVKPEVFFAGLSDLVRWGRRDGAEVHLLSLTPVSVKKLSADQWRRYLLYDSLIREVGRYHGVPLIDLADNGSDPFSPAYMLAGDGIHLLAAGQAWLARRVYAHLMGERRKE